MLYTPALMLITVWLLALVDDYTMNGFVYVLPVLAIAMVLLNSRLEGKRA